MTISRNQLDEAAFWHQNVCLDCDAIFDPSEQEECLDCGSDAAYSAEFLRRIDTYLRDMED
jgi:rRNA maturation endonuclease Nob1